MRALQVFTSMAVMIALVSSAPPEKDFGDIENIDVEQLLNDEASWKSIYQCLMDKAPCGDWQKLRGKIYTLVFEFDKSCVFRNRNQDYEITYLLLTGFGNDVFRVFHVSVCPDEHDFLINNLTNFYNFFPAAKKYICKKF